MTTMLEPELESDPYLISLVRGGDTDAFGKLYERHVSAARRLARVLTRDPSDADDLVAETFTKVLSALRSGHGPDTAFRAYLLTTLRHTLYDRAKRDRRVEYTDDLTSYERLVPQDDPLVSDLESGYAARAFARLPERWRAVLWHTEVEGESPAQVAPLLGLTPNGVAALAYRARERLRQMYLQEHIAVTSSPRCHWTGTHLAGYVRAGLARRDRSKVEDHLAECPECRVLHRELTEENSGLRGVLATLLLGSAAPGYLADAGRTGAGLLAAMVAMLVAGWQTVLGWCADLAAAAGTFAYKLWGLPRRLIERYGPGNVAAASGLVAAGLVGVGVFAGLLVQSGQPEPPTTALPLPVPAQPPAPPAPTAPAQLTPPIVSYPPPTLAPLSPPPPTTKAPIKATTARPVIAYEPADSQLAAAETGTLPIAVRMAESTAQPESLSMGVLLPNGIKLAGQDAGDGWRCRAANRDVTCERAGPVKAGRTVARLPLAVGADVSGYQGFAVTVAAGANSAKSTLRAPIAPAGMRIGYAATGAVGYGLGGNTLIACQPRPVCLSGDNNMQQMTPALPVDREPGAPRGLLAPGGPTSPAGQLQELAGPKAASGAHVTIPAGAKVRWAGLTITASDKRAPGLAAIHGPGGGWYPINLKPMKASSADRPVAQSFADVTELVRADGGGAWWVVTKAADLPAGLGQFAGWSLAVVYDRPSAPSAELAVYLGPKQLRTDEQLSVLLDAGKVDVGLVVWDGDQALTGDSLLLGKVPVGDGANVAVGANSSNVACTLPAASCVWRTPGLDLLRHQLAVGVGAAATLLAGNDPLDVGLFAVMTETGQGSGAPSQGR